MWDDKLVTLVHRWVAARSRGTAGLSTISTATGSTTEGSTCPFVTAAEPSANVNVRAASGYRGVDPNKSRWPPLTTVSTEPGLQAGSQACRNYAAPICRRKVSMSK
jgi:hypothetical protein